jgi:hypothetical protein
MNRVRTNCFRTNCFRTAIVGAALGILILAGCGGGDGLEMYPVRGEVTYNGKPVSQGIVTYTPTTPGVGRTANGPLQPDGTFVMTTLKRDDGVMRGAYNIVIHSYAEDPGAPQSREEIEAQGTRVKKMKSIVPEKYTSPETSGLTDAVDANHSGAKKIELTDG